MIWYACSKFFKIYCSIRLDIKHKGYFVSRFHTVAVWQGWQIFSCLFLNIYCPSFFSCPLGCRFSSPSSLQLFACKHAECNGCCCQSAACNKITPLGPASYRTSAPLGLNLGPSIKLMQSQMCGGQTTHILSLKEFRDSGRHFLF